MASTFGELSKSLRGVAAAIPEGANRIKQQVARAINISLLENTPVDTGLAVSNWQVQLDEGASEQRDAFVPSPSGYMKGKHGSRVWTHQADTEATRQANIAPATELANVTIASAQPGQPIHITNVVEYINALDEGHSAQAELFVDKAFIFAQDTLASAKLL